MIGVLVFRDPIGPGIPAAVEAMTRAGVRTVLMADHPTGGGDIESLARAAGILRRGVVAAHLRRSRLTLNSASGMAALPAALISTACGRADRR